MAKKKTEEKTQKKGLYCALILDESGSMSHLRDSTIEEANKWIFDQAAEGPDDLFTLVTFDGNARNPAVNKRPCVRFLIDAIPLKEARELSHNDYNPDGGTPLYDAIGTTIQHIEADERSQSRDVVIVVMTDGDENTSAEHSRQSIAAKIKSKESDGWSILYLGGGGQNAKVVAAAAGFTPTMAVNYNSNTQHGNGRAYAATSATVSGLRAASASGLSYAARNDVASSTLHNALDVENSVVPKDTANGL